MPHNLALPHRAAIGALALKSRRVSANRECK